MSKTKSTENKPMKVANKIDAAEEIIQLSYDAIITAVITETLEGIIKSWNPAAERLYGYDAKEAIGQHISIITIPEFIHEIKKILKKVREGERVPSYETRNKTKLGAIINVSISIFPIMDEITNKIVGATLIAHDITPIKIANDFQSILEATPDSMIIFNTQGIITFANARTESLFGYSKIETVGQSVEMLIPELNPQMLAELRKNSFVGSTLMPKGMGIEVSGKNKDGKIFTIEININPKEIETRDGPVAIAAIRDITEQRLASETISKALQESARSNKELEEFAYVVSHDLKAPLRAIRSLEEWIIKDTDNQLSHESKKNLTMLHQRVERMSNMISGILSYARAGRMDMNITTVNVKKLLDEVIDSLSPSKKFHIHYDKNLPIFATRGVQLSQVFSNLISNSIKYHHHQEGHINIAVKDIGIFYEFSVTDDGPGIDHDNQKKIFNIFQTLQSRDKIESTGIGLSIVKKIIESQGGKITVDSALGKGTTMKFTWPKIRI
jgi:PAS domain S-box-containing protein